MDVVSLARGAPSLDLLPVAELADCARAAIERDPSVLGYGPAGGYPPPRSRLAEQHGVEPERVMITNGSLQGFLFVANAFGGRVVVEAPTYDRPLKRLLGDLGAEVATVPVDDEGADVEALAQELERGQPSFAYVIPTFQNPSGQTLSPAGTGSRSSPATVSSSSRTTRTAWSGSRGRRCRPSSSSRAGGT